MKPTILLTFANDDTRHLQYLKEESRRVKEVFHSLEGEMVLEREESVEARDIYQAFLRYGNQIVIFHYGGHAGQKELALEDTIIQGESLADLIKVQSRNQLQLVFLNGCATVPLVKKFLDIGVKAVIATSASVGDEQAMRFSEAFYQALVQDNTLEEAYQSATALLDMSRENGKKEFKVFRGVGIEDDGSSIWGLFIQDDQPEVLNWKLSHAIENPFIGLPPLQDSIKLPQRPFKALHWFTRDDAKVFFGRGREVSELYHKVTASSGDAVILLYGQSGVGKSSLLHAGLLPRLEEQWDIEYIRTAHLEALKQVRPAGRRYLYIFDQLEELITLHSARSTEYAEAFLLELNQLLSSGSDSTWKFILSFRKEYFAEFEAILSRYGIGYAKMYLEPIKKHGIIEITKGLTFTSAAQHKYGLTIEEGLPGQIAYDISQDVDSNIAPTLQILLTKMWEEAIARNRSKPAFTQELYHQLKKEGLLLREYLENVIEKLERSEDPERSTWATSGLILDVLHYFTTQQGTAAEQSKAELDERYGHIENRPALIEYLRNNYLLTESSGDGAGEVRYRLAHDALAPLIREKFDQSNLDGQRARRILENRMPDANTAEDDIPVLGKVDYRQVVKGELGMRNCSANERALLEKSRQKIVAQERWRRLVVGVIFLLTIGVLIFGWNANAQKKEALRQANISEARRLTNLSIQLVREKKFVDAIWIAKEAKNLSPELHVAEQALVEIFSSIDRNAFFLPEKTIVESDSNFFESVRFSPRGNFIEVSLKRKGAKLFNKEGELILQVSSTIGGSYNNQVGFEFSPNEKYILTRDADESLKLWDSNGRLISSLKSSIGKVVFALFTPDENYIFTTSGNKGYLWDLKGELKAEFQGHKKPIVKVLISPDGKTVLTKSLDKEINWWTIGGDLIYDIDWPTNAFNFSSFSPDGQSILCFSDNPKSPNNRAKGFVWLWSLEDSLVLIKKFDTPVESAKYAPNGRDILVVTSNSTMLFDQKGKEIAVYDNPSFVPGWPTFSKSGDYVLLKSYNASLWDIEMNNMVNFEFRTNQNSATISPNSMLVLTRDKKMPTILWSAKGNILSVLNPDASSFHNSASFSNDNQYIVTASNQRVELWQLHNNFYANFDKHTSLILDAKFSPDGQKVLTSSMDLTTKLWNLDGNCLSNHETTDYRYARQASFSPDGLHFLTINTDRKISIWDINGNQISEFNQIDDNPVNEAVFSPDGQQVLVNSSMGPARIWSMKGDLQATLHTETNFSTTAQFSPGGEVLLTNSSIQQQNSIKNIIRLWNVEGDLIGTIGNYSSSNGAFSKFSPDGKYIITYSEMGTQIWGLKGNLIATLSQECGQIGEPIWSPTNNLILACCEFPTQADSIAKLWNIEGQLIIKLAGHKASIRSGVFSPDGKYIVTYSYDGTAKLWSCKGKLLANFNRHISSINNIQFSPNGEYILTSSQPDMMSIPDLWDRTVKLWDLKGNLIANLNKHSDSINSAVFSPDGNYILTGSSDNTAKLWNLKGELVADLNKHSGRVSKAIFSPNGEYILTASEDNTVKLWPTPIKTQQWLKDNPILPLSFTEKEIYGFKK